METVLVILGIVAVIFLGRFFLNSNKVNSLFKDVADEYISLTAKGAGRQLSNRMIILKKLTGNASYSISSEATAVIEQFDVADTMQFLLFFNNSIKTKLDTIPYMSTDDVTRNDRSMIIRTGLTETQRSFLQASQHLRSDAIDHMAQFKTLAPMLIRDCNLWHRIENIPSQQSPPAAQYTTSSSQLTNNIFPNRYNNIRFAMLENGKPVDLTFIEVESEGYSNYSVLWKLVLLTASFKSERVSSEVQVDFDTRTSPPRISIRFIDCTKELEHQVKGILQRAGRI